LPHRAFALQTRQNLGCNLLTLLRSLRASASAKSCYALLALKATIVLSDFGRSSSADGKKKIKPQNVNNPKIRHWLVRVAQAKLSQKLSQNQTQPRVSFGYFSLTAKEK
jgi:hypothetical protein